MKDFLKKILLPVLGVVLVGLVAIELVARNRPNNSYKIKSDYMEAHAEDIEMLILGPSGASLGIKPDLLDYKCFNCANFMQSFLYDNFIFKKYFNSMTSLKYLVLDLNFIGFHTSRISPGFDGESKISNYAVYFGAPFFCNNLFDNKLKISKPIFNLYREDVQPCDSNGFIFPKWEQRPLDKFREDAEGTATAYNKMIERTSDTIFDYNKKLVEEMIALCQSKNVKVIIITFPTNYVAEKMDKSVLAKTAQTVNELTEKYSNVTYMDFTDSKLFELDEFFNANHLNYNGAYKLTHMLNDSIRKWEGR